MSSKRSLLLPGLVEVAVLITAALLAPSRVSGETGTSTAKKTAPDAPGGDAQATVAPAGPAPVATSAPAKGAAKAGPGDKKGQGGKKGSTTGSAAEGGEQGSTDGDVGDSTEEAAASGGEARQQSAHATDLRQFEERTFPRHHPSREPPPQLEGGRPSPRAPRPSAVNPPPVLRSAPHRALRRAKVDQPPAWIAQLALPDLPVRWDPKLIRYLEFYRRHPRGRALMRYWLQRRSIHGAMIARVLRQYGLPDALSYVAMIESSYDPTLTSRVGAAGLWQFMVHSGRAYGLRRDHWVDERRNPSRSTDAAARHLKELYRRFGTWELALAAYNAGPGMIIAAMRKYNTNDYWQLCRYEAGLPWSTTLYVPKILAAAIVGGNLSFFGFDDIEPLPRFERQFELVAVERSITVKGIAAAVGTNGETIGALNPELRRGRTPPRAKVWVRVPKGSSERVYAWMGARRRAHYRPYVVRLGDTEQRLAGRFGISRGALRRINRLSDASELRPGLTILVPARAPSPVSQPKEKGDEPAAVVVALPEGSPEHLPGRQRVFYRVVLGDTLAEIARRLQVDGDDLASWNGLDRDARLVSDMVLQAFVAPSFDRSRARLVDPQRVELMVAGSEAFLDRYEQSKGRRRLVYRTRKGDTLRRVARRFGLSVGSLMRINRFPRSTKLKPGQPVIVYAKQRSRGTGRARRKASSRKGAATPPRSHRPPAGERIARRYRVRPGDTLSGIAVRFGISVETLMRLNRLGSPDQLKAGQTLQVSSGASSKGKGRPRAAKVQGRRDRKKTAGR